MNDFKNNIQALVFDHYGTLFDKLAVAKVIEDTFPGHGAELARLWFEKIKEYCWLSGLMERYLTWDDITRRALSYAGKTLSLDVTEDLHKSLIEADLLLPPFPEVPEALARLESRFTLVILTMATAWMVERSLEHAGVRQHFKQVISAETIQAFKPEGRVYEMAVTFLGIPKEQVGFVSGNSFDVIGGKNFGFPTFWLNRAGEVLDELGPQPDLTTTNLAELATALGT